MIFGLSYIPHHGVYRLHEAFDHFVQIGCDRPAFGSACFPDWFAPVFRCCPKLRKLSKTLWAALRSSSEDLARVRLMWTTLGNVETLCIDTTQLLVFDQPSELTTTAIRTLFDYLYDDCLSVKAYKDSCGDIFSHYYQFVKESACVCPFCGLEAYPDLDSGNRAAYDHYLCRSRYPLLSVCFRNLVPTCDRCNEAPHKGHTDLLRRDDGVRRKVYYPYGQVGGVTISVGWSVKRSIGNPGQCELSIGPRDPSETEQVNTWIALYRIPKRATARIQTNFDIWLKTILRHRAFTAKPTVAQLRELFRSEAGALNDLAVFRRETDALYKHGLYAYLADVASDAELEGIASIATSRAVFTPVAVR